MSKALSTTEMAVKAIRHADRVALKRAMKTVERGMMDATVIDDDGMSVMDAAGAPLEEARSVVNDPKRKRVAMDLRKPKRESPVYAEFMIRRIESAEKLDAAADQGGPVHLNVGSVTIVQAQTYESVNVDARETK